MRSTRDFLTGVLTGVAIGILTAPRSGKETRDKLKEEANKRSDDLKDQWSKGIDQVKQGYEQAKSQVNQYADKAKQQYNDMRSQPLNEIDKQQAKNGYNDKVDQLADKTESGVNAARESLKVN
jgi:gas vesicle protein